MGCLTGYSGSAFRSLGLDGCWTALEQRDFGGHVFLKSKFIAFVCAVVRRRGWMGVLGTRQEDCWRELVILRTQ